MAKTSKPAQIEWTVENRVRSLIELTGGQCPYDMVVASEVEAREARALLKKSKQPGAKLIEVTIKR